MSNKSETKIGKDVIESLTLGMYEDPRYIYREYIQNSADQIDKALEDGTLSSIRDSKIDVEIKPEAKIISFIDNATGIISNNVGPVLKNIAKSSKDRSKNKGFRGIGRLAGLAYCTELIFETSYKGENVKTFLFWDSNKLKAIINNRSEHEEAATVIDDITDLRVEPENSDKHYFKVTLTGITNEKLLNIDDITEYLSMVAPVPYKKGFIFRQLIHEKANELDFNLDEYQIYINCDQIYKEYTTMIYDGEDHTKKRTIDEIKQIEFFELRDRDNLLLAWGWYGLSSLKKQMQKINTARGIRLRKGNIQIGLEDALAKHFKENRGSNYFFGEVFANSAQLIPNSQRNYFSENATLHTFERKLRTKFMDLNNLYRLSSNLRTEQKKINEYNSSVKKYEDKKIRGNFTNSEEKKKLESQIEEKRKKAEEAIAKIEKIKKDESKSNDEKKIIELVTDDQKEISESPEATKSKKSDYRSSKLSSYGTKERKVIERIYSVINEFLPPELSEPVIQKIEEELKK